MLPGQPLQHHYPSFNSQIYHQNAHGLVPYYAGYPALKKTKKQEILNFQKFAIQYIPAKNDLVIGRVKLRTSENFIVDFNAPLDGVLGGLEFDGATKRNKPNLQPGDLVYTRVIDYSKFMGGRLSCINKGLTKKDSSNQLGQLKAGSLTQVPVYKQSILKPYLQRIGKCTKFQIALAKNGFIWINCARVQNLMLIINMIKAVTEEDPQKLVSREDVFTKMLTLIK